MPLKVSYNNPALPKGQEIDLGGFMVKNGSTVELTKEQEESIVARIGVSVKDYFAGSEDVKVDGTALVTVAATKPSVEVLSEKKEVNE